MEELLDDAISIADGMGGKIVGMLSALLVTIMTVVKVVRWATKTAETQVSDLANLILLELNQPVDKVVLRETKVPYKEEVTTPEGIKIKKSYGGVNPFASVIEVLFKEEDVTHRLTKTERKLIRSHYFNTVARKLASVKAAKQKEFEARVNASLNNAIKSDIKQCIM